jgi:PBP1b-binding outer membrane lipoprotein LpoB
VSGSKSSVFVALSLAVVLSGCTSKAGWQYQASATRVAASPVPVVVGVEHFKDQRGTENSRYFWVCGIPLVPYCTSTYEQLENANGFLTEAAYNFRPSDDLAKATADELQQAGLFQEVYVTDRPADPNANLLMRGTITDTDWVGTQYSYLLSVYGSLLYLLGLPIGTVNDSLSLKLELVNNTNGQVLWTHEIAEHYEKTEGLYYNFSQDFGYPQMFHEGIAPAISELQNFVNSQPPTFWTQMHKPAAALNQRE